MRVQSRERRITSQAHYPSTSLRVGLLLRPLSARLRAASRALRVAPR